MTIIEQIKAEIERRLKKYATDVTMPLEALGKVILELKGILSFLSTLESEKPMNPEDAMKELNEKIALVKQRGTWDGVDVDKYMDEVRGREPEKPMQEGLEEEIQKYMSERWKFGCINPTIPVYLYDFTTDELKECARHFVQWQKEQDEMSKVNYEGARAVYDNTVQHLQEKIDEKYELGKKDMREQMLNDAVEGVLVDNVDGTQEICLHGNRYGDKVRVIILPKEDEK